LTDANVEQNERVAPLFRARLIVACHVQPGFRSPIDARSEERAFRSEANGS
jgi:hypothetical protein